MLHTKFGLSRMKNFLVIICALISIGCTSQSRIENWHNNPGKIILPKKIFLLENNPAYIYETRPVIVGSGVDGQVRLDSVAFSQGTDLGFVAGANTITAAAIGAGSMALKAIVDAFKDKSFTKDDIKLASGLSIVYAESAYSFKDRVELLKRNKNASATYGVFPVLVRFEGVNEPLKKHDYAVFVKSKEKLRGHVIYRGIPLELATPEHVNSRSYLMLLQDQQKNGTLPRISR